MPSLEARGSHKVRQQQEGQNKGAPGTEASPGGEGGRRATGSAIVDHEFSQILWARLSVVVQSLSHVRLCNPVDCSVQASLSVTVSWSLFKLVPLSR